MTLKARLQPLAFSAFLTGALLATSSLPVSAAEYEFKFGAITTGTTSVFTQVLMPLAKAIETESGGRIAIDLKPQGGFGPPITLLPAVESGELDMANALSGYYPGRFPRSSVLELPGLFDTGEAGSRIAWKLYQEGLIADDYKSLKVIGLFAGASYGLMTVDKDVKSLKDLRGMRVRTSGAIVGLAMARLGMIPLGLPANMLGQALKDKWVDALAIGFEIAASSVSTPPRKAIDEVSTLIDAHISSSLQMIVMNKKRFESLPPDLQAVIERHVGPQLGIAAGTLSDAGDNKVKNAAKSDPKYSFITLSDADKAEFAARIEPVLDDWASDVGAAGVDGMKLIERVRALAHTPSS